MVRRLIRPVTPGSDLRNACLIAFRRQTEAECRLRGKYVDQNKRPDLELLEDSEGLNARKGTVARLFALDRWVPVDAEYCPDGKRLADNSDVPGLEHDDQRERARLVALSLPEWNRDRAIGNADTRSGVAFRDPLV